MKRTQVPFTLSLAALALFAWSAAAGVAQVSQWYEDTRKIVQQTQDDLNRVRMQGPRSEKERERIDNARKHLSDFDRNLSKNKFDKDRLDSAIDDVKNVLENNTLEARDRDALTADLNDLRRIRAMRGE